eukprot:1816285-Prymnesium_polylepis.2
MLKNRVRGCGHHDGGVRWTAARPSLYLSRTGWIEWRGRVRWWWSRGGAAWSAAPDASPPIFGAVLAP